MIPGGLVNTILSSQLIPVALPVPAFMQASPIGYAGAMRSMSSGQNAISSYRAAADMTGVEVTISNALIWESAGASESYPSDGFNLQVIVTLWSPQVPLTKTTRFLASTVPSGATSALLSSDSAGATMEYVEFSNGDFRWCKFSGTGAAGSTERRTITWDKPTTSSAASNPRSWAMTNKGTFQFNGASPGILTGGQFSVIKGTINGLSIKKGDPVYVICNVSRVGGGTFLMPGNQQPNYQDNLSNGLLESLNDSSTNYTGTRLGAAPWYNVVGGGYVFRPIALRGLNISNNTYKPLTVIGDSIGSHPTSWVQQLMHKNTVPFLNLCKAGENFGQFIAAGNPVRPQVLSGGVALVQMGRNSWSLSGAQAMWAWLRARGYTKIIQVLPPPQTTGTFTDEAGQTPDTVTQGVNAQIVALIGQPDGPTAVWDTYTACRGTDPQKWAAGFTGDGTHPTQLAIDSILAYAISQNWMNDLL